MNPTRLPSPRQLAGICTVALMLTIIGCSGPPAGGESGEGFNVQEGTNSGDPTEIDVEFALENNTNGELLIDPAATSSPGWLAVKRDDEELAIREDCRLPCPCDESDGCVDCGIPSPQLETLPAGEELRTDWDGTEFEIVEEGLHRCYEETTVDPHETLEAEVCYGVEVSDQSDTGMLEDPVCETVEFKPGLADEVVITVEDEPVEPEPIDFAIENESSSPVYIQDAYGLTPPWVRVRHDGRMHQLRRECADPCLCATLEQQDHGCAICDIDAGLGVDELSPGEQRRVTWDGTGYGAGLVDDMACLEEVEFTDEILEVEMCYGFATEPGEHGDQLVADPSCETLEFQLGVDDEAVVTVEQDPEPTEDSAEFILENDSDEPILIQRGTLPKPGWLSVMGDEHTQINLEPDCEVPCECGADICEPCVSEVPHVERLGPGEAEVFEWDGIDHAVVEESDGLCWEKRQITEEIFDVEICYGRSVDDQNAAQYVDDEVCETAEFHFGFDRQLVVVAQ